MEKYKMCPFCSTYNPAKLFECVKCGTDLMNVSEVDKIDIELLDMNNNFHNYSINKFKKANNFSNAYKNINAKKFFLQSVDKDYVYEISKPLCIIGRDNEMKEYLKDKSYVSRMHAKIILVNNELYITNLSKTNYTYLNNVKLEENTPCLLKNDDEIGFGGIVKNNIRQKEAAYFIVKIQE